MKNVKKFLTIITAFTLAVVMVCTQPIKVCAATAGADMYAQRATEELVIDDVTYTLHYFYEDGKRAISIENSKNSRVEKVTYDPATETMSYYEGADGQLEPNSSSGDWILMGSSSHRVTWGEGMSAAAVAAAIAAGLGFLGAAGVIAAMGTAALGVLAAGATGGTIYLTTYYMNVPYQGTQYLYVWSFTANTGDSYGPYQYMSAPGIIS